MSAAKRFEGLNAELAQVAEQLATVEIETRAIHEDGKTDGKTLDTLSRLSSKRAVLTARQAEITAALPAAEYEALVEVSAERRARLDEVITTLKAEEVNVSNQLDELFNYKGVSVSFPEIVRAARPVHELHMAKMRAMNAYDAAEQRRVAFAFDNGIEIRKRLATPAA